MSKTEIVSPEQMIQKMREEIAKQRYGLVKDYGPLLSLGLSPSEVKRNSKGGRPPSHYFMPSLSDAPHSWPRIAYKPEHIVQLVLKQKWQAGLPFSNGDGDKNNKCFAAVAGLFKSNPREIRRKYYQVDAEKRERIENGLIAVLLEHDEIHPDRLEQAKEKQKK